MTGQWEEFNTSFAQFNLGWLAENPGIIKMIRGGTEVSAERHHDIGGMAGFISKFSVEKEVPFRLVGPVYVNTGTWSL